MVVICNNLYPIDEKTEYTRYFDKFPYGLSSFQQYAIEAILLNQHVLITAHTGSGKTLPAEFAIEHLVAKGKKVIYTSPIKALSNQKFYDFTNKFPHISFGLFTGDIKTNPEADVLIMTTEILMNRLFNQSSTDDNVLEFQMDFENELAAVIFDEVHYINDPDRGQVWEKAILMLPEHIQMIMLSATLDKPERFAEWIETNHPSKQVYLCPTTHRVVPLTHYGYITMGEHEFKLIKDKTLKERMRFLTKEPIMLQDHKGKFYAQGYDQIKEVRTVLDKQRIRINRKFCLNQLAKHLKNKNLLPAIAFVFSRKNVESCAHELTANILEDDTKIPYIVQKEAEQIIRRLPNYQEYLRLPEYVQLVKLLEKGVGIHHSGMIPILREIVELCISKKYIKFLFATESFAIGLDCPIKTAIFTGATKYDGDFDRTLHSHEYTQMAGRAGRRGIDDFGYIIHCCNLFRNLPSSIEYKAMMGGKPPSLISKFKIDYNLILNVLKSTPDVTIQSLVEFVSKSMLFDELEVEIHHQRNTYLDMKEEVEKMKMDLEQSIKTPRGLCAVYLDHISSMRTCQPKKKKQFTKKLEELEQEYPHIEQDSLQLSHVQDQEKLLEKERKNLDNIENHVKHQVMCICDILQKEQFLTIENSTIVPTINGSICSHIAEVHGPIWITCMIDKWNYFEGFTSKQIVGVLSCITDVKVKSDYDISIPVINDEFLKSRLLEMKGMYLLYEQEEGEKCINTGIRYDDAFQFNIVEEAMNWCDCKTEEECKLFISKNLTPKEISLGDFTKAIMKIATTAKELRGLYELEWCRTQTEWLHKLTQIEEMVLKYIATNQSLYV